MYGSASVSPQGGPLRGGNKARNPSLTARFGQTRYLRSRPEDFLAYVIQFIPLEVKQGQYLAFIYAYGRIFRQPPAEADMQRHFQVSPPSVHQMVLTLERAGLIRRTPGVARSIEILVEPEDLPVLR